MCIRDSFTVNETGVHTKIMSNAISFPFLSSAHQKEILSLQASSIFKQINRLQSKEKQIFHLQEEISYLRIEEQLQNPSLQLKIANFEQLIKKGICTDLSNAFWERRKHIISLPYEPNFNEKDIPTKARPTQMNFKLLEHCKKEIQSLLDKKPIRPSKSLWSYAAFYVNNVAEKERGVPRLVINYKPLNKVLQWILSNSKQKRFTK